MKTNTLAVLATLIGALILSQPGQTSEPPAVAIAAADNNDPPAVEFCCSHCGTDCKCGPDCLCDTRSYAVGATLAKLHKKPLVTYIGKNAKPRPHAGCVVSREDSLNGYQDGQVLVSVWNKSEHRGYLTKDSQPTDAEIDALVAQIYAHSNAAKVQVQNAVTFQHPAFNSQIICGPGG